MNIIVIKDGRIKNKSKLSEITVSLLISIWPLFLYFYNNCGDLYDKEKTTEDRAITERSDQDILRYMAIHATLETINSLKKKNWHEIYAHIFVAWTETKEWAKRDVMYVLWRYVT